MTTEPLTVDPPDPLRAFAGLLLLPQTIRVQSEASMPSEPNNLDSIHQFMKSMGLRNAEKLLEESKAIVDNGSEILNANFPRFKATLDLDDHVAAKVEKEKPRERRPGLGRKRARFSMKPDTSSQPNISLESSLDVDQLQDPEEYFLACEKLENAKQELNRQMGVVADDSNINNLPTTARHRRPGILGKSVRYKHRFSSVPPDDNDIDMSSQETLKQDDLCALKSDLQKENSNDVELEELELTGLITEKESRVSAILDELLSRDAKDLDGDRVLSLLQEQFQMKPPDLSALCMPEFPAARTDYMTLGERIPKVRKSVLGLPNSDKRTSDKRQREESLQSNLTSSTPPKSPFSSLALLRKQVLKSNPLRDPFSPLNIDLNDINKSSDQVGSAKDFSKSGNLLGECNIKGMNISDHQADRSAETNAQSSNIDISHSGSHAQMGDCGGHTDAGHMVMRGLEQLNNEQSLENSGGETIAVGQGDSHGSMERCNGWNHMDIRTADENSGMQNRDTEVQPSGHDITDKEKMHDTCIFMQGLSPAQVQVEADDKTNTSNETETDIQNNVSCRTDEHVEDMPSMSAFPEEQEHNGNDAHTSENWSGNQNPSDQSNSAAVQNHSMDMQSALPDINPEQHIMKQHPLTKKQPRKNSSLPGNRERKALKFRPSLADAGTLFEDGVRRSKRIKSRPLEFWKGERLLFGRVNESMKLVGVKYVSPSVGNMKVKSYISDEYKEVVDLAARY
nr:centromere protein C [Ipomoea batatas]